MRKMLKLFPKGVRTLALAVMCPGLAICSDPSTATITSPAGPITVATNQSISFTATSDSTLTSYVVNSYAWDFGNGIKGAGASTQYTYTTAGTYTVTLTVSYSYQLCKIQNPDGSCQTYQNKTGTATATRTITVLSPASITSFSANKTSDEVGKVVTLSWTTANATSLSISGVGSVMGTSSVVVYPTVATTYTLTASGAVGVPATSSVMVSTYTIGVGISPGSATIKYGGTQVLTGTVSPDNSGVNWSTTGGSLAVGSGTGGAGTYSNTFTGATSGSFNVQVASREDSARTAVATITVQTVSVATPVALPANANTNVGGSVSFSAVVSGAANSGVTWSVSGGGTINSAGVFTAGAQTFSNGQPNAWAVTATSVADPTKRASASVYVVPLLVSISPSNVITVRSGQTQSYSATVSGSGSPSQAVTWKVDGIANGNATVGTITTGGVYTAPNTPGDHTITATSQQDASGVGNVTVHVPGWVLVWKRDIVYLGTREAAEFDTAGMHVTQVDHLGSPCIVTGPSGSLESQQKYLPYGELLEQIKQGQTSITTAKGYTGHEQTDPSGLIYMQARFYVPWFGRFASPDPARDQHFEETQSWNIYSYVRNSPIMSTDPTGMESADGDGKIKQSSIASRMNPVSNLESIADENDGKKKATEAAQTGGGGGAGKKDSTSVADIANSKVGSTDYLQSQASGKYPAGANKCNKLPADAIEASGLPRPQVSKTGIIGWIEGLLGGGKRDPTAHEWADPKISIPGWSSPMPVSGARAGDVIAQQHGDWGHVGVVAAPGQTVSVNSAVNPAGSVTRNDWGFRSAPYNGESSRDPAPVIRRYLGGD